MGNLDAWTNVFGQDNKVKLVKKITEKTKERKIAWQKTGNAIIASLPGRLKMNFVEAPFATSFFGPRWIIFMVRDEAGNEILKVENNSSGGITSSTEPSILLMLAGDPVMSAVTELYNVIQSQTPKGEIEKAIEFLDNI